MTVETPATVAPDVAKAITRLQDELTGRVITIADAEYDATRQLFYAGIDPFPAAIARVANDDDVTRVVSIARDAGIPIAVRSGGHSIAGHSTNAGGLVLDVRDMHRIDIDAASGTAWAESGLTAIEVGNATAEHGLAIGFGDTGSVGIPGITLGGGQGYLSRNHGLAIDNLLAADVVTADGKRIRTDTGHEPDLFWAIRGGGGNFGVATRFQYRLHALPTIAGGLLVQPATVETVAGFTAAAEAASDAVSAIANVMPAPPMPFLPESAVGKLVMLSIVCYSGDPAGADAALAPFRALATPLADMIQTITYPELFPPEDPSYRPLAVSRNMFIERVDDAVASSMMAALEASDASLRAVQIRPLGGAIARVPADATAYAHRARRIMVNVASFYDTEEDRPRRQKWVDDLWRSLAGDDLAAYVNFLGDEGPERVRSAYPGGTWDRLRALKARYDPDNFFHSNQNIPPAESAGAEARPRRTEPAGGPMRFRTTIEQSGKTAMGFQVPESVVEALGAGKRPKVRVTINGYTYRSSVAPMGGTYMVGLSSENRGPAGITGPGAAEVDLELDTAPREVVVPDDFAGALDADPAARQMFDGLSYSNKSWHVLQIQAAKADETRRRRIEKSIEALRQGRIR